MQASPPLWNFCLPVSNDDSTVKLDENNIKEPSPPISSPSWNIYLPVSNDNSTVKLDEDKEPNPHQNVAQAIHNYASCKKEEL